MAADLSAPPPAPSLRWTALPTPVGDLTVVVGPRGIIAAGFGTEPAPSKIPIAVRDDAGLASLLEEGRAYLAGERRALRTPVDLDAIAAGFARGVLAATMRVPYGELRTYGDVAADAGSPRAWRAAGTALRHCPVELWIPCHRVVPAGRDLGPYGGHPEIRAFLLELEGSLPG
jgi:methylated-DNA-[protein]-cysteine S-methyltransferase